jgi:hypothetical protein
VMKGGCSYELAAKLFNMDGNLHQIIPNKFYKQIINIETYFQKKNHHLYHFIYSIIGFNKVLKGHVGLVLVI